MTTNKNAKVWTAKVEWYDREEQSWRICLKSSTDTYRRCGQWVDDCLDRVLLNNPNAYAACGIVYVEAA